MTRYVGFLKGLALSNSMEIRILASTACSDGRGTTGSNLRNILKETKVMLETSSKQVIRNSLAKPSVAKEEEWRIPLLSRLLKERSTLEDTDTSHYDSLIDMICCSTLE